MFECFWELCLVRLGWIMSMCERVFLEEFLMCFEGIRMNIVWFLKLFLRYSLNIPWGPSAGLGLKPGPGQFPSAFRRYVWWDWGEFWVYVRETSLRMSSYVLLLSGWILDGFLKYSLDIPYIFLRYSSASLVHSLSISIPPLRYSSCISHVFLRRSLDIP